VLVSPSAINAWDTCQRKWAWKAIDGVAGSNPYAEFGTAVHAIIEGYLKHGIIPDRSTPEGACAWEFFPELPPTGSLLAIEQHFTAAPFHGYIDVLEPGAIPTVHDHKTCGTHRYAIQSLKDDTQAAVYALFAFTTYPQAPAVNLHWNYGTRQRTKILPVHQTVTRADIAPTIERATRTATAIAAAKATARTALELAPNPLACEQYGGCVYKDRCNLTADQKLLALLGQNMNANEFLASVSAQVNGTAQPPPPPPPPPPQGPANPWDALPPTYLREGEWWNGSAWIPMTPPATAAQLPPPPPAQQAPAPAAINPPPVYTAPGVTAPAAPVETAPPARRPGRPRKGTVEGAPGTGPSWAPSVAEALRALADALEGV
jgi:hypothetical protein